MYAFPVLAFVPMGAWGTLSFEVSLFYKEGIMNNLGQ